MADSFKIAVAGLGTVGAEVVLHLQSNANAISEKVGRKVEVIAVSARDKSKDRGLNLQAIKWCDNPLELPSIQEVDMVVELIGGESGVARDLAMATVNNCKHLVTANKALLSACGAMIAQKAEEIKVSIGIEAAVAGGIPVIGVLKESLAANSISSVIGILNGTCNYILTRMEREGGDFAAILKDAQDLGYAEANPAFDVEGLDTAHKLSILSAIAFGGNINNHFMKTVEGISRISKEDIDYARQMGYRIKLLGLAKRDGDKVYQAVQPYLVPLIHPLANVSDVYNAIEILAEPVGQIVLQGRGAGAGPTSSAVLGDICDIAKGKPLSIFGKPVADLNNFSEFHHSELKCPYYIRLNVIDRPGVVAEISSVMRDYNISIESLFQKAKNIGEPVNIVMTTHETDELSMGKAISAIAALKSNVNNMHFLRIFNL